MGKGRKPVWAPHTSSPHDLKQRLEAERTGQPHLVYRTENDEQVIKPLDSDAGVVTIGRGGLAEICLSWDSGVSRIHAELTRIGDIWTLVDDGLSRNGSFVNGKRVVGRQRLEDGDVLSFGSTMVVFRSAASSYKPTEPARAMARPTTVTASERCVLVALCRPLLSAERPLPATNHEIAGELCLSIPAVKRRLGILFERFELGTLPPNEKRAKLADLAVQDALVTLRDL